MFNRKLIKLWDSHITGNHAAIKTDSVGKYMIRKPDFHNELSEKTGYKTMYICIEKIWKEGH